MFINSLFTIFFLYQWLLYQWKIIKCGISLLSLHREILLCLTQSLALRKKCVLWYIHLLILKVRYHLLFTIDRPYLMIIQRNKGSIVEGESMELCCLPNSNPHVYYIAWLRNKSELALWRQHATNNFDKLNNDFCFRIHSVYRNHTGNYMCLAENSIAKSNSSIAINVLCE